MPGEGNARDLRISLGDCVFPIRDLPESAPGVAYLTCEICNFWRTFMQILDWKYAVAERYMRVVGVSLPGRTGLRNLRNMERENRFQVFKIS